MHDSRDLLRSTDIYLIDQLFRDRINHRARIFDAGCGSGRNLPYFLANGYEVSGLDPRPEAIAQVRAMAKQFAPHAPEDNFRCESLQDCSFPERCADVVLSSAVLHFAPDNATFHAMLKSTWHLLELGGLFFCRLASDIGMEGRFKPLGGRRFSLLDGSERYLVNQPYLLELTQELGGTLLDPIKTTVVQDQRCMTTWVLRRDR